MTSQKGILVFVLAVIVMSALILSSCGGGGGGSSTPGGGGGGGPLTITTYEVLPGTHGGVSYSAQLAATGGRAPYHWSIVRVSETALFPDGVTINADTGVLSGTVNWQGTAGFIAIVQDADSQTSRKGFYITAYPGLTAAPTKSYSTGVYQDVVGMSVDVQGGVQPLTFTVTGGALPRGIRLDTATGRLAGAPLDLGNYVATVTIKDGYTPPASVTQQLSINVVPQSLQLALSVPSKLPLNVPYSGKVVAVGGTPPYRFALVGGALPVGIGPLDTATGTISGTPTVNGAYSFTVRVTDSASPVQTMTNSYSITVANALGRNDSIATATPLTNNYALYGASISPYIDPPDKAPLPGDNDYYKVVAIGGSTAQFETYGSRYDSSSLLDTVLEFVDGNGVRLTTCRQPGDTSSNFTSPCINDDMNANTTDSSLDLQVPGAPATPSTFYVHVLDWRGDGRPDMRYELHYTVQLPLAIYPSSLKPASRGRNYWRDLQASNGIGASFSVVGGALPPGITMSAQGSLTGTPTANGTYAFTVQAVDSSTPPQRATADLSIQVVDPVAISSPATWPDACVNEPYTFAAQTSGGATPFRWGFYSNQWPPINLDSSTGIFTGTATVTGTFTGTVSVSDATDYVVSQTVSLTVKNCP